MSPHHTFRLIKGDPDDRDLKFTFAEAPPTTPVNAGSYLRTTMRGIPRPSFLPTTFDLRKGVTKVPPILDQGPIGACAPNQLSSALRFCLANQKLIDFEPSRLFIYFFARLIDGSAITDDSGITIRSGLKAIQRFGAPKEELCPYVPANFTKQPSKEAVLSARLKVASSFQYLSVAPTLEYIKRAILAGFPVILGVVVYNSMESKECLTTGSISMPNRTSETCYGGHCVSLWGWDDAKKVFYMMNTWGTSAGNKGWFTIPYAYILDPELAFDFWTIRLWK